MEKGRTLVVVPSGDLSHVSWHRHGQLCGGVYLAIEYLGNGLTAILTGFPCIDERRNMFGSVTNTERTTADDDDDGGFSCFVQSAYQLLLQPNKVQIVAIGVFSACAFVPSESHHVLATTHNVEVAIFRSLDSSIHLGLRHAAWVPALVHETEVGCGRNALQSAQNGPHLLFGLGLTPVAHDVLVVGIDARNQHFLVLFCIKRQQVVGILEQHDAVSRCFQGRLLVLGVVNNAVARFNVAVRTLEKTQPELHGEYASHAFINPTFGNTPLAHQLHHGRLPLWAVHVHVHTGHNALVKGLFVVCSCAMLVHTMLNIHPVAHHKSAEAPFFSQHIVHQPAVGVAGNAVQFVVRHHHIPVATLLNGGLERWEKHLAQGAFGHVAGRTVGAIDGV